MLYHKDVFMPRRIRESFLQLTRGRESHWLRHTKHAIKAANSDRYGVIQLPPVISFNGMEIIEIEHDGKKCVKAVVREVGQEKNRVFVVVPETLGLWTLKTVWYNLASDKHSTLKRHLYVSQPR